MNGTRAGRRLVAVATALAMGVLAACGGGNSGSSSESADKADLSWQFWVGGTEDQVAWQKVADQAHTDHAGITVKLQGTDWNNYWSKIGTLLASGKALRRSRWVDHRTDLKGLAIRGFGPVPYQVDGDYLGEVDQLVFRHEPEVLDLVLPSAP